MSEQTYTLSEKLVQAIVAVLGEMPAKLSHRVLVDIEVELMGQNKPTTPPTPE
jgi:hypothetical protein